MIQAIFFDIDGTLIPHGETSMPTSTLQALWALKEKGVKLFIATGRPPGSIQHVQRMFPFDGFLTANGQYCFCEKEIIYEKYIPQSSIETLLPYVEEHHLPILIATTTCCYRNQYNTDDYDARWPITDLSTITHHKIVQIMAHISPQEDDAFLKHLPLCKSARWTDAFADIIPIQGGKDYGIDQIIQYFNIPLSDVMAFGDGGNDLTMLQHVPYGIAMGNAHEHVKEHAYYTTTDIHEDGIANALIHFGVLPSSFIKKP